MIGLTVSFVVVSAAAQLAHVHAHICNHSEKYTLKVLFQCHLLGDIFFCLQFALLSEMSALEICQPFCVHTIPPIDLSVF